MPPVPLRKSARLAEMLDKKSPRKTPRPERANIPLFRDGNPENAGSSGSTSTTGDPMTAIVGGTPGARDKSWNYFNEIGITGVSRAAGFIQEEFLTELQGSNGMKKFREMRDNSADVGGVMFAFEMPIRQVTWRVEPFDNSADSMFKAKFIEQCLDDMSTSWRDTVTEFGSMLTYGFSLHEICYKVRGGRSPDKLYKSKYDDGLIGWQKMPIRAQESLFRWEIDAAGGIQGMWQLAAPDYHLRFIPIDKAMLFRTTSFKNNPEGRSILRSAYWSWYYLKKIAEYEGIGVERDLAGIPVAYVPSEVAFAGPGSPFASQYANIQSIVRDLKKDEQAGLVIPSDRDERGNPFYELQLISANGSRSHDTPAIIQRYRQQIAGSVLADFTQLGHSAVGSRALADPKIEFFILGVNAMLDSICDVLNAHGVSRLLRLNSWDTENAPKIVHGEVRSPDLLQLGMYFQALAAAGMPLFPNATLENWLLGIAKAPKIAETGILVPAPDEDAQARPTRRGAGPGFTVDKPTNPNNPDGDGAQVDAQGKPVKPVNAAQVNATMKRRSGEDSLPDSAFALVVGRTADGRAGRLFAYRDAQGRVDMAKARKALEDLAHIPMRPRMRAKVEKTLRDAIRYRRMSRRAA
jgi:hypothetical protein